MEGRVVVFTPPTQEPGNEAIHLHVHVQAYLVHVHVLLTTHTHTPSWSGDGDEGYPGGEVWEDTLLDGVLTCVARVCRCVSCER